MAVVIQKAAELITGIGFNMNWNKFLLLFSMLCVLPLSSVAGLIFNQSFDNNKDADYSNVSLKPISFTGKLLLKPGYILNSAVCGNEGIKEAVYQFKGIWQDKRGTIGFSLKAGNLSRNTTLFVISGQTDSLKFLIQNGQLSAKLKSKNGTCTLQLDNPPVDKQSGFKNYYFSWNGKRFNCNGKKFGKLKFSPDFNFNKISIGPGNAETKTYLLDEITVWDEWTPPSLNTKTFINCTGWLTNPGADKAFRTLEEKVRILRRKGNPVPYADIPLAIAGIVGIRIRHKLQIPAVLDKYQKFVEKSCSNELASLNQDKKELPKINYKKFLLKNKSFVDSTGNQVLMFRIMYNPDVWFLSPFSDEFINYIGRSATRKKIEFLLEGEKFGVYASPADLVRRIPRGALGYALSSREGKQYVTEIINKLVKHHPFNTPNLFMFNFLNFEFAGGICYAKENIAGFTKWLKNRYNTIELLNFTWSTCYKNFKQCVPPKWKPGLYKIFPDNRAAWGDWLEYMTWKNAHDYQKIKSVFDIALKPDAPTNYIDSSIDAYANKTGVTCIDWEKLAKINDIMIAENNMRTIPPLYGIEPFGTMQADFRTTLINSNQVVVNMEMHCGTFGAQKFEDNYYACAIWRDFLHGKSAIHLWQAMRPWGESLFRGKPYSPTPSTVLLHKRQTPKMLFNMYKATLDTKRLAKTIVKFRMAPTKFALLFSNTSLRQLPVSEIFKAGKWLGHEQSLRKFYSALLPLGYRTGFLTENMIKNGKATEYKAVILPGVSHLPTNVVRKLSEYVKKGGILVIGANSLLFDEHNRAVDYLAALFERQGWLTNDKLKIPYQKVVTEKNFSDYLVLLNYKRESLNIVLEGSGKTIGGIAEIVKTLNKSKVILKFGKRAGALANRPALLKTAFGKGQIYFFTTRVKPETMAVIFEQIQSSKSVLRATYQGKLFTSGELRWIKTKDGKTYAYLINLLNRPVKGVKLESQKGKVKYRNLISGKTFNGTLDLQALETVIFEII